MTHTANTETKVGDVIDIAIPCRVVAVGKEGEETFVISSIPTQPQATYTITLDPKEAI